MYLSPKDLLQVSRLSKQFRSMLASRSAVFVWQTVFLNVDLKCFHDLNEIQFASLIYDKCCMVNFFLFLSLYSFFFCITNIQLYTYWYICSVFRHADVTWRDALHVSGSRFVWDCVDLVKLWSNLFFSHNLFLSNLNNWPSWFFFSFFFLGGGVLVSLPSVNCWINIQTPLTSSAACLLRASSRKPVYWSISFYLWRNQSLAIGLFPMWNMKQTSGIIIK